MAKNGRPKKKDGLVPLSIEIEKDTRQQIEKISREEDLPMSNLCRRLIKRGIEKWPRTNQQS